MDNDAGNSELPLSFWAELSADDEDADFAQSTAKTNRIDAHAYRLTQGRGMTAVLERERRANAQPAVSNVLGDEDSNSCPTGYHVVESEADCETACVVGLGISYSGATSKPDMPGALPPAHLDAATLNL